MILIDSGNTRLKVAILRAGRAESATALDNDDPAALDRWLGGLPTAPCQALGSNVAGPARAEAIEAALARRQCAATWVRPRTHALGLTSRYTDPTQLGPDRWAAMLGVMVGNAAAQEAHPFLLASFGTATTLDCVSADGVFEGGAILPGPAMMRKSLASGTADLPLTHGPAVAFPRDTGQAISTGVAAAQAGALLRQWLAALERFGATPRLYVTGGGWPDVEAETRRMLAHAASHIAAAPPPPCVLANPVLDGLAGLASEGLL